MSFTGGQVGWTTKTSCAAHVLVDLHVDLAVGEARDVGVAQRDVQVLGDLLGQRPVRVAGEELQLVRPWRFAVLTVAPGRSWLGREDSNLRIRGPKSRALPLGHAPRSKPHVPVVRVLIARGSRARSASAPPSSPARPRHPRPDLPRLVQGARHAEHRRPAARHRSRPALPPRAGPPSSCRSPGSAGSTAASSPCRALAATRSGRSRRRAPRSPARRPSRRPSTAPACTRPYTSAVLTAARAGFTSTSAWPLRRAASSRSPRPVATAAPPPQEERHVHAELRPPAPAAAPAASAAPTAIQARERRRRIARTAAQPGRHRDPLARADPTPPPRSSPPSAAARAARITRLPSSVGKPGSSCAVTASRPPPASAGRTGPPPACTVAIS